MRWNGARTRSSRSIGACEGDEASLRDWFTQMLGTEEDAVELMQRCERLEVEAGEIIVKSGDAADSMHFILDGRVGIMVPTDEGRTTRVRSLGRYTTIGEMGLVSRAPRSATIQAEVASILYVLSAPQFEAIKREDPALGQKLLDLFRLGDGRAAYLCQPHDRGAARGKCRPAYAGTMLCVLDVLVLRYPLHWDRRT